MSEWTPPPAVAQDYPQNRVEQDGFRRLIDAVAGLRRDLRESTSNLLSTAGIFVTRAGMRIGSSLTVEGDLDVTGDAAFSGDTVIGGNATITGTLSLPAGIIDNDALTSPVTFDSDRQSEYGFSTATTEANRAMSSVTVPAGYTQALVTVFASCLVKNTTASTQYVYLRARVETSGGAFQYSLRQQITLSAGFWGTLIVPMIAAFPGLTGGDIITGMGVVSASAALTADPAVVADSEVSVTFSR